MCCVVDRDGVHPDGDAAFAFEVHAVEDLVAEIALGDGAGLEQELVGQRALAVVDVGDDGEVADQLRVGHGWLYFSSVASCKCSVQDTSFGDGRIDGARQGVAQRNGMTVRVSQLRICLWK